MFSVDGCERVLAAGANLKIEGVSADACVRLAATAKMLGVHLEIKGGYSVDAAVRIAAAGGKHVTFDLTG